jgi:hypothetical protein
VERIIYLTCAAILALGGCADVEVHKIAPGGNGDCVKGFRYYLPRPYVLVKRPILLGATTRLAILRPEQIPQHPPQAAGPLSADTGAAGGPASADAIEVVFLPDFDEQYAVQTSCLCAHAQSKLTIRDGWQLLDVNGKFDSTAVAHDVLQTIDTAVGVVRAAAGPLPHVKEAEPGGSAVPPGAQRVLVEITEEDFIPPGLYRVNKPWEKGEEEPCGPDLLARLGLPRQRSTSIRPRAALASFDAGMLPAAETARK